MGISSGIADLFKTMANLLHIEANSINGIVKYQINDINNLMQEKEYVWNYIIIKGTYYLIDVSMGSGACNRNTFQKLFLTFILGQIQNFLFIPISLKIANGNYYLILLNIVNLVLWLH